MSATEQERELLFAAFDAGFDGYGGGILLFFGLAIVSLGSVGVVLTASAAVAPPLAWLAPVWTGR